jgi:hypothetical protein
MEAVDALIGTLRKSGPDAQASVKADLLTLARGENGHRVRDYLDDVKRGELLETQWIIEEVIDETAPPPPEAPPSAPQEAPAETPEAADPNQELSAADLQLVYDDPNGLMLHKSRVGDRWFATQVDPRTGQPQTFELHPQEIEQIQAQLKGSPYWLIGS